MNISEEEWSERVVELADRELSETGDTIMTFSHPEDRRTDEESRERLRRLFSDGLAEKGWAVDVEIDDEPCETIILIQGVRP